MKIDSSIWKNAVDYATYLQDCENIIKEYKADPAMDESSYLEYYELGLTRMNRVDKTYTIDPALEAKFVEKNFDGSILIISESWCGDAAMTVPVVNAFFSEKIPVKITYRDSSELIDHFLTNGTKSIPIVLILDKEGDVISHWGPRPTYGTQLLAKYKSNPEEYPKEEFYKDLQVLYTKNKGYDTIQEIIDIIP